jgi:hypothetical protein
MNVYPDSTKEEFLTIVEERNGEEFKEVMDAR